MRRSMLNNEALAVILLLLGGITARISITGEYRNYVKPGLQPLLLIAAAALLAIGGATLWPAITRRRSFAANRTVAAVRDHDGQATTSDGHDHDHAAAPGVGWLLLAPVMALVLLAPPALGADAAANAGTALSAPTGDFPPLPDGDPVELTLNDYATRAVFDEGHSLTDRKVELTGFVTLGPNGEIFLARMIVSCCAADARPIKIGLEGEVPSDVAADTWLTVIGRYTPTRTSDDVNGAAIPYIDVVSAAPTTQPTDPYSS
jgi:uncharacterized repeat protein (TIGR03943 family)